jgi:hypothetical protein
MCSCHGSTRHLVRRWLVHGDDHRMLRIMKVGCPVHILEAWKEGHKGTMAPSSAASWRRRSGGPSKRSSRRCTGRKPNLRPSPLILSFSSLLAMGRAMAATSFATGRSPPPRIASCTRYARRAPAQLRPYGVAQPPHHVR